MTNISQQKREKMIAFLETLKAQHTDDESIIALGEIEKELKSKKYGLVWEEHEENVDVMMKTHIPVFTEAKEKNIWCDPNNEQCNFLLEGDNLHSLRLLEKTHRNRIDVIYIDPPYNHGVHGKDDFVYDDRFVGSEDTFIHSKWLSFMEKRLKVAYNLLSDDGLIFISIDDNEQANLKVLMDEIFGDNNFIIAIPRITKKSGKTTGSFSKNHDYVLVYTKRNQDIFVMEEHTDPDFKYEDEWVEERGKYKLNQTLDYDSLSYSASLDYPLSVENETFYPGGSKEEWEKRQNGEHRRADWAWRWNRQLFDFGYRNGFVVIKRKDDGTARIYTKTYLNAKIIKDENNDYRIEYVQRTKAMSSIALVDNMFSNDNAKKDLAKFGLQDDFDYSKPVELIKRLIKSHYNKNAIVLDFFAGSGTTAQAVLELNIEDEGQRSFILCTNNQNDICEKITYVRCKKVITSYEYSNDIYTILFEHKLKVSDIGNSDLSETIKSLKKENKALYDKFKVEIKDNYLYLYGITVKTSLNGIPSNLTYLRTDFVSKDSEELSDDLLSHIREMIQLEHGIKLDDKKYVIIMDDDEMDEFEKNITNYPDLKAVFINQDVLLTASQTKMLENIDYYTIPDYYFDFELREAGETW